MKKSLFVLLLLALVFGVFTVAPQTALAAVTSVDVGSQSVPVISNNFDGTDWTWEALPKTLTLDGYSGGAIMINCDLNDTINLVYNGTVTITAGAGVHAILCSGSLNISEGSSGTLTLNAGNDGITANNDITISGGAVHITATRHGISTFEDVTISGGTVNINADQQGIYASNDVAISGGTVDITSAGLRGIYAFNDVAISGGTVNIVAPNGSGIYANTGSVAISDGTVNIPSAGLVGINAGNDVAISGGAVDITSSEDGIYADNAVTISGGAVDISSISNGIYAINGSVTISGGAVEIIAPNLNGIYAGFGNIAISGGTVEIIATNGRGINALFGNVAISGGSGTIRGNPSVIARGTLTANGVLVKGYDGVADYTVASDINTLVIGDTFVDASSLTTPLTNIKFITPAPIYSGWFYTPPKTAKTSVQNSFPAQGVVTAKRISVYRYEALTTRLFYLGKGETFTLLGLANNGRAFHIEKDGREGYIAMKDIKATFGAPLSGNALKKAGAYNLLESGKYKRIGYYPKEQILWIHGIDGKYLINKQPNATYYLDAAQWRLSAVSGR